MIERGPRAVSTSSLSVALVAVQLVLGATLGGAWLQWPLPWTWVPAELSTALAMACGLAALLLALRAWSDLGPAFRVRPEPRAGAQLVRRGVYRRLRHPMYTSVCLIAVGMFLHHPGTTTLLLALANLGFYVAKARYEESLLRRRFADYPSYRTQTHGVIPWAAGRAASKNPSRRGRSH